LKNSSEAGVTFLCGFVLFVIFCKGLILFRYVFIVHLYTVSTGEIGMNTL